MLDYRVIRSERKTLAIEVRANGEIWVRAPRRLTTRIIAEMVAERTAWIEKKRSELQAEQVVRPAHTYHEGEMHLYLGQYLPLFYGDALASENPVLSNRIVLGKRSAHTATSLEHWYRKQANILFPVMVNEMARHTNLIPTRLSITSARTRWGSCSARGAISLSWRLVMAPIAVIEYVMVHELAHLREHNHSARFWKVVEQFHPQYREHREWLKVNGRILLG
ncbi:MAG: M48 family metallopeptidase [Anaerolineae bacterium]|nr:M48 family metallopeptidase [Anaerolineae bacterium]